MNSKSDIRIPAEASALPELEGDPAQVDAFATEMRQAASRMEDFAEFAWGSAVLDGWEGGAAAAYGNRVTSVADNAGPAGTAFRAVRAAAVTYSDALSDLKSRLVDLSEDRAAYSHNRVTLRDAKLETSNDELEVIHTLIHRSEEVTDQYTQLEDAIRAWVADAAAADSAFSDALFPLGGASSVNFMTSQAVEASPSFPIDGANAETIAAWWAALTPAEKDAMVTVRPELVGNLDGLPSAIRDDANLLALNADITNFRNLDNQNELTDSDREAYRNALATLEALRNPSMVDPITGERVPMLLTVYKPYAHVGDGGVAISLGNPDEAENLAISVPGMMNSMEAVGDGVNNAYNLYHSSVTAAPGARTAVMFWLDYNSPDFDSANFDADVVGAISPDAAVDGAENLNRMMRGLAVQNDGNPLITAVGHSYGSMLVAQAAASSPEPLFDQVVLIGSPGPGPGIETATDLNVGNGHVYVGVASEDPVAGALAVHGAETASNRFDGERFRAESVDRESDTGFDDHNAYFDTTFHKDERVTYSESVYNMGQIVAGNHDNVLDAERQSIAVTARGVHRGPDPESERSPEAQGVDLEKLRDEYENLQD